MKRLLLFVMCVVVAGLSFGAGSVSVTDSAGITVSFDAPPTRVVSAAPNITETVFALGKGDLLIGRTDYCDYPPEAASVPSIGSIREPNVEKIVELQPDVVIASTHFSEDVAKTLEDLGIQVMYLYDPNSFDGVYTIITTVGTVLGADDEAAEIVAEMKAEVEEVTSTIAGAARRPSVYYVVGFGQWGDFTAGGDTFIGEMLDMAGADNIASDLEGWAYSLEKIVEADPEIMICSQHWGAKEGLESTDGYRELSAVVEGRLFAFDNDAVDRQGPRLAMGLRALAEIIHPELF